MSKEKPIELLEAYHVDIPTKRWVPVEDYIELQEENTRLRAALDVFFGLPDNEATKPLKEKARAALAKDGDGE